MDTTGMTRARAFAAHGRGSRHKTELAAKVAFLSRVQSYPAGTHEVARIETHLSWVFLTDAHAYKLKKPVRTAWVDLRSLAARAHNSTEEVRLNRRLSSNVYLGVIPLVKDAAGNLAMADSGEVVDWIVEMRRLPSDRMLDNLIRSGKVSPNDIAALVRRLCDFYRRSAPAAIPPDRYRQDFVDSIAACRRELCRPAYNLSAERVKHVCARQLAFLSRTALFDARVHRRQDRRRARRPATRAHLPRSGASDHRLPGVLAPAAHARRRRRTWISRAGVRAPGRARHRQPDSRCRARRKRRRDARSSRRFLPELPRLCARDAGDPASAGLARSRIPQNGPRERAQYLELALAHAERCA